jgi:hypothetical protein
LLQLDRAERWILLQSIVLLPLVALLLRTIGLARSWGLLRRSSPPVPLSMSGEGERTVRMVDMATRHLPWRPSCLPRSLVLWFLLRRQGIPAELRIGVQKREQRLEAHAWVEVERRVVNDAPDIAALFPPFENIAEGLRAAAS